MIEETERGMIEETKIGGGVESPREKSGWNEMEGDYHGFLKQGASNAVNNDQPTDRSKTPVTRNRWSIYSTRT